MWRGHQQCAAILLFGAHGTSERDHSVADNDFDVVCEVESDLSLTTALRALRVSSRSFDD
jgi:hypothetical protein